MSAEFYQIHQLKKNAYRITSSENVFMDLFVGSHHALLWDTGYGFGDLLAAVRTITSLPLIVVNSHGHPDHACGNFRFDGPVYIHPEDIPLCEKFNSTASRTAAIDSAKHFFNLSLQEEVSLLPEGFDEGAYINAVSPPLLPLDEGHRFDLGGIELEVIHFPGHTGGSLGLLWRAENLLYVGDAIAGFLFLFLPESKNLSTYLSTLDKAEALPFSHMVLGHRADPMPRDLLQVFRRSALELDYDKGLPFHAMPGMEAIPGTRVCPLSGQSMDDFDRPDFAAIVIDPSHLM